MNGDAGKTCAKSKQETWFHHSVDSYGELIFAAELRGHDIGEFVTLHPLGKKKVRLAGRLRRLAKIGAMRVPQTSHEATFLCWSLKLSADSWFLVFFLDILQFFVCPYIIVRILACCPFPIWTDSPQYDNRYSYSAHRWLIWLSRHRIFFRVPVSIRCVVYWLSNHRFIDIKRCRSRTADTTITQSTFFLSPEFFSIYLYLSSHFIWLPPSCAFEVRRNCRSPSCRWRKRWHAQCIWKFP